MRAYIREEVAPNLHCPVYKAASFSSEDNPRFASDIITGYI